jgi:hypothetical protein
MGLDTEILFKSRTSEPDIGAIPDGFSIVQILATRATHKISTMARFYSEDYERGPWPQICAVLMRLFACPDVERVWYGHDCAEPPEITPERVCQLSRHYMTSKPN